MELSASEHELSRAYIAIRESTMNLDRLRCQRQIIQRVYWHRSALRIAYLLWHPFFAPLSLSISFSRSLTPTNYRNSLHTCGGMPVVIRFIKQSIPQHSHLDAPYIKAILVIYCLIFIWGKLKFKSFVRFCSCWVCQIKLAAAEITGEQRADEYRLERCCFCCGSSGVVCSSRITKTHRYGEREMKRDKDREKERPRIDVSYVYVSS